MAYKVKTKRHCRGNPNKGGEVFEVGDMIEPTEAELSAFPERFELVQVIQAQAPSDLPEEEKRGPGRPPKS